CRSFAAPLLPSLLKLIPITHHKGSYEEELSQCQEGPVCPQTPQRFCINILWSLPLSMHSISKFRKGTVSTSQPITQATPVPWTSFIRLSIHVFCLLGAEHSSISSQSPDRGIGLFWASRLPSWSICSVSNLFSAKGPMACCNTGESV
ncbi:hypothetical protein GOODEAATRI_022137, partial [Goodea atripinnis]